MIFFITFIRLNKYSDAEYNNSREITETISIKPSHANLRVSIRIPILF